MLQCLSNLSESSLFTANPWDYGDEQYSSLHKKSLTKESFRKACTDNRLEHLFYSGVVGTNEHYRSNSDNPPHRLTHLVVDYDADYGSDGPPDNWTDRLPFSDLLPSYMSSTYSRGVRLVWELEEPLPLDGTKHHYREVIRALRKNLKLTQLLAGLDVKALENPYMFYERGLNWVQLNPKKLSSNRILSWMLQGSFNRMRVNQGVAIPLPVIAEEAERRWPGRWQGEWEPGSRGVRFWDPDANADSVILHESNTGCCCFTGDRAFMSWSDIFGNSFVSRYADDRCEEIVSPFWYDRLRNCYWRESARKTYKKVTANELRIHLKAVKSVSDAKSRDKTSTELEDVLSFIFENKSVDAAVPLLYREPGLIRNGEEARLNISNVRAMQPADEEKGLKCPPWINRFLKAIFPSQHERNIFLSWLKVGYTGALNCDPVPGQCLYLVGPVKTGKTFLVGRIVAAMFGGGKMDPTSFLTGETTFIERLLQVPIWHVDDSSPLSDTKTRTHFTSKIKSCVANRDFTMHPKGKDMVGGIEWYGRIVVCANDDEKSLRILPDLDMGTRDKFIFLRIDEKGAAFLKRELNPKKVDAKLKEIDSEIPAFCRWLLTWTIPTTCQGDERFIVDAYKHADLVARAQSEDYSFSFTEVLSQWIKQPLEYGQWSGTATALLSELRLSPLAEEVRNMTVQRFGLLLKKVISLGFPITISGHARRRIYTIKRDDVEKWENETATK